MRGRKPKPTALKQQLGNPGKRALNKKEPRPNTGLPTCPTFITGEARKEWKRVGRLLAAMKVVTEADRTALALYCQLYARWVEAEKAIAANGAVVRGSNGQAMLNPYLRIANGAIKQLQPLLAEFGLTPSSRSRLQAVVGDESLAEALFLQVLKDDED